MSGRFIEGALRAVAVAAGVGAGVAGCFAVNRLITILDNPATLFGIRLSDLINAASPDVIVFTQASAGLAIGLGALCLLVAISILLRICKCKLGSAGKLILIADMIIIFLCLAGFGCGGVIGSIGANGWSTDIIDPVNSLDPALLQVIDIIVQTRDALAATAAVSLFACLLFIFLEVWMIIFAARHFKNLQYDSYI